VCGLESAQTGEVSREVEGKPGRERRDDGEGEHRCCDERDNVYYLLVSCYGGGRVLRGFGSVVGEATAEEVEGADVGEEGCEEADEDRLEGEEVEDAEEVGVGDV